MVLFKSVLIKGGKHSITIDGLQLIMHELLVLSWGLPNVSLHPCFSPVNLKEVFVQYYMYNTSYSILKSKVTLCLYYNVVDHDTHIYLILQLDSNSHLNIGDIGPTLLCTIQAIAETLCKIKE